MDKKGVLKIKVVTTDHEDIPTLKVIDDMRLLCMEYIRRWGYEPSAFAMHPATHYKLQEGYRRVVYTYHEIGRTFQGIEILRSEDVPEDEIRVY